MQNDIDRWLPHLARTAIIGRSGSGKDTLLANLLHRWKTETDNILWCGTGSSKTIDLLASAQLAPHYVSDPKLIMSWIHIRSQQQRAEKSKLRMLVVVDLRAPILDQGMIRELGNSGLNLGCVCIYVCYSPHNLPGFAQCDTLIHFFSPSSPWRHILGWTLHPISALLKSGWTPEKVQEAFQATVSQDNFRAFVVHQLAGNKPPRCSWFDTCPPNCRHSSNVLRMVQSWVLPELARIIVLQYLCRAMQ